RPGARAKLTCTHKKLGDLAWRIQDETPCPTTGSQIKSRFDRFPPSLETNILALSAGIGKRVSPVSISPPIFRSNEIVRSRSALLSLPSVNGNATFSGLNSPLLASFS